MRNVVILGGTGVFGKRLASHLIKFDGIALTVTSRSRERAQKRAAELRCSNPVATVSALALDTKTDIQSQLKECVPWAVIDCSGPFQSANYETAKAVLKAGAHMIDLADARDYLLGYRDGLDAIAKECKRSATAGASSTPALSTAVVNELVKDMHQIENIDIAIVPGGQSEVGEAVISAVLSYAGKQIPVWKNGELDHQLGWRDAKTINLPCLGNRRVAPVETVDAEWLSKMYKVTGHITFSAGLESSLEQRGIELLAWLRSVSWFPNPQFLVPWLKRARAITRLFNGDRGGMIVRVEGTDDAGDSIQKRWSLLAENDHGPSVPILAAAAALRQLMADQIPSGVAIARMPLAMIEQEMRDYDISTRIDVL